MENIILNHQEIEHKIKRIAYQIFETFVDEKEIIIAGIDSNGYIFAEKIAENFQQISTIKVTLCKISINKKNVFDAIETSINESIYKNKAIVLLDDVLNSGNTLMYSVKHFLKVPLIKLKTAVLIDRNHKKFPVKVDFKGISLSTSSSEHVTVIFDTKNSYAYLKY